MNNIVNKLGVFVTGTGTCVGKTVISSAIIRLIMNTGMRVGVMKPIETGCKTKKGSLVSADGRYLSRAAELALSSEQAAPYRFKLPLAPMVAADIESQPPVSPSNLLRLINEAKEICDFITLEGAGGLMVPISRIDGRIKEHVRSAKKIYYMADLIKEIDLPVIIVSQPELGTINHTMLSVDFAIKMGIKLKGIIINQTTPRRMTYASKTNPEVLKELCSVPIFGVFPYLKKLTFDEIEKATLENLDCERIKQSLGLFRNY